MGFTKVQRPDTSTCATIKNAVNFFAERSNVEGAVKNLKHHMMLKIEAVLLFLVIRDEISIRTSITVVAAAYRRELS